MEFQTGARIAYFRCIATAVSGFATGMAPIMSVEVARRTLSDHLRPEADELEDMLKQVGMGEQCMVEALFILLPVEKTIGKPVQIVQQGV